jgi:hypothetical protein
MTVEFRKVHYTRESGNLYYPFWRVEYEIDGERQWQDVQAQNAVAAHQIVCQELSVPYRAL